MSKEIQRDEQGRPIYGVTVQIAALLVITMQYVQSFATPALATIKKAYASIGVDDTMIANIQGIPSLMAIFGAILVGVLERYLKKRTILVIALILMFGGSLAGLCPESEFGFYMLLATRVMLGLGRGMIFPMASSFIADLFFGAQKARLMSWKTAVGGLSGSLFQIIGGLLAVLSWRYAFIGMLMWVPIAILCVAWLKEPEVKAAGGVDESGKKGNALKSITPFAWIMFVVFGFWNIFQFVYVANTTLLIKAYGLGESAMAGYIMSLETAMSAVAALLYPLWRGKVGGFDMVIAIALEAIGYTIIVNHGADTTMFVAGTICYGLGFGTFNPILILQLVHVLPKEGATLGLSLLAAAQNFCQFLSANILAVVNPLFGLDTSAAGKFASAMYGSWFYCVAIAIVLIILRVKAPQLIATYKVKQQND